MNYTGGLRIVRCAGPPLKSGMAVHKPEKRSNCMTRTAESTCCHTNNPGLAADTGWNTPGYIQPQLLRELWFHTGTACNLACPFCLEGSAPGDHRLQQVTADEARPFLDAKAWRWAWNSFLLRAESPLSTKKFSTSCDTLWSAVPAWCLRMGRSPLRAGGRTCSGCATRPIRFGFASASFLLFPGP